MSDFVSGYWSWFITVPTVAGIVWLLFFTRSQSKSGSTDGETTGHVWDEDLQEYNNPLPLWWRNLFYLTIAFGVVYLALYPGLGSFPGLLGWTSKGEYEDEVRAADAQFGPIYADFLQQDLEKVAANKDALRIGERLFVNYCASCHGSDARGSRGFPNLRDTEWMYGGDPKAIETTILNGRQGVMPAWEIPLGGQDGVNAMAEYVLQLSGREYDAQLAAIGKEKYPQLCIGCHGPEAKGNPAIGAPDLTNNIWLHGGSRQSIRETIGAGRMGRMPAHKDFLGEAKVHLLAAYVASLTGDYETFSDER
ncbi:MAG: cytochrome-c oxidase, cbb3-type subunit III [Gammaproteobacteria bacterium]|nr:cytochrome-c oxidase, cbb3-type subunit III [Gammaproteobacteria bacterium]